MTRGRVVTLAMQQCLKTDASWMIMVTTAEQQMNYAPPYPLVKAVYWQAL